MIFLHVLHLLPLLSTFSLILSVAPAEVTVLDLNEDTASARYLGHVPIEKILGSVTACGRVFIKSFKGRDPFMQLRLSTYHSSDRFRIELWVDKVRPVMANTWRFLMPQEHLKPNRWYHVCVTYEAAGPQSKYELYLDGTAVATLWFEVIWPVNGDGFFVGRSDSDAKSMDAFITQVNMWDYVLDPDDILSIANCSSDLQGNYVSWNNGFELTNMTSSTKNLESLCQQTVGVTYMWFPYVSDKEAFYLCDALGTHLPLPADHGECFEIHRVSREAWSSNEYFFGFITPLSDDIQEGKFYRNFDRQVVPYSKLLWTHDEPNGDVYENCILMSEFGYYDTECMGIHCATCKFEEQKVFTLRGTCERELRNTYFFAQQTDGVGSLWFKGYGRYQIQKQKSWVWLDGTTPIATMDQADFNYPMGRRTWTLTGQVSICGQKSGKRQISLSVCKELEFTCDNALCVALAKRCDLKYDCQDQSDEKDCNLISFPVGYRSDLPPTVSSGFATEVSMALTISALGVDTSKTQLYATYLMQLWWQDDRLSYRNMKASNSLNLVPPELMHQIWTPVVGFVNTERNEHTTVDEESSMVVIRKTVMQEWNTSSSVEEELYPGRGNDLHLSRKYTTLFVCDFDLNLYPFDVQRCAIELQLMAASSGQLVFQRQQVTADYTGPNYLMEYEVGALNLNFSYGSESGAYREVMIQVTLGRRSGYAILTIYIPSLILLIICYVTLFFRPEIFEVRVMSALTSLLVVATLFTQASSSLPKTSYFKMVDIWLLFCIGVIFLIIIFHALVDASLNHSETSNAWVPATARRIIYRTAAKWLPEKPARRKDNWKASWRNYVFGASTASNSAASPGDVPAISVNIAQHDNKLRRRQFNDDEIHKNEANEAFNHLDEDLKPDVIHNLHRDSIDVDIANLVAARLNKEKDDTRNMSKAKKFNSKHKSLDDQFLPHVEAVLTKKNKKSDAVEKDNGGSTNKRADRLILCSKIVILVLVIIFNFAYWGYILT
ncbi:Neurotransmitter-gated ion-channel ligand-binding domain [Trinorchestia longiramus]|nr:Neurotransmitter-gated ion-channel ligand-binding domain [Trinorchestia longiramus]